MPVAGPHPLWSAVLTGDWLTVHRPGGRVWFDGGITVTREWTRSVRAHRTLLLITGPFTGAFDFHSAAAAGRLLLLTTPTRLADALQSRSPPNSHRPFMDDSHVWGIPMEWLSNSDGGGCYPNFASYRQRPGPVASRFAWWKVGAGSGADSWGYTGRDGDARSDGHGDCGGIG
ncbi:hypothetical protein [Kitasatospora purpeofusca]|uniref:hypothetical protein n=1 Tax=Kitasatospora purpeofusca TaxID=67352 RepID=UPI00365E0EF0